MAEDRAPLRRITAAEEWLHRDEFELAYSTPHNVWLPRPWPRGLGRRTYRLISIEDRTEWEVSTVTTTRTRRSLGVSGVTITKPPQRKPSDIPGLPWPCWMTGFKVSSDQSDVVEMHYSLAVAVEGTMVTLFGTRQTSDDLVEAAATLTWVPPRLRAPRST